MGRFDSAENVWVTTNSCGLDCVFEHWQMAADHISEMKKEFPDLGPWRYEKYCPSRERDRLLVLATKHCDKTHHDWQEILRIAGDAQQ